MVWQRAFDLGLILYYAQGCADGENGDLVHVGPPLIVTESQVQAVVQILQQAIADVFGAENIRK